MSEHAPDKLSALDRAFLTIEAGPLHMHVGAVTVFEGGGLVGPDGGLDFATLKAAVSRAIAPHPRFRQHVREVPLLGAVWSDDPHFRLDFHVRHTAIPRPGTRAQLHALAGRLFSQRLDRERPLWEMWVVEGCESGRFAIITKAHHAMLDGVAGMGLLASLFSMEPGPLGASEPHPAVPPTEHGPLDLARSLFQRRVEELPQLRERMRELISHEGRGRAKNAVGGALDLLKSTFTPSAATPYNPTAIGPHRAFDGVRLSLDRLKAIRRALGGTLNDVVLAVVTGALHRHVARRGHAPAEIGELRTLVPVNIRPKEAAGSHGNRVAMLIAHLPVGERDALARLASIREHTEQLKRGSHEVEAAELVEELADLGPESLVGAIFQAALHFLPFHLVVTNVPGPPFPLYLGPARLTELYPLVPLFARQSFGIALASYDGGLFVGVNADADAMPDLAALLDDLVAAEAELFALVPADGDVPVP
jgi:WS/DGAT/MGAT family acyltransferase